MKGTEEKLFEVMYDTKKDRLVLRKQTWIRKMMRKIKTHKLITTIAMAFFMFATLNVVMIYNFMKLLQNI